MWCQQCSISLDIRKKMKKQKTKALNLPNLQIHMGLPSPESGCRAIKVSIIYSDWQWLSRVLRRSVLHHLLPNNFNWRCRGLNLGSSAYQAVALPLSHSPTHRNHATSWKFLCSLFLLPFCIGAWFIVSQWHASLVLWNCHSCGAVLNKKQLMDVEGCWSGLADSYKSRIKDQV